MKKILLIGVVLIFFAISAYGETLKGGYGACVSEDLFDQLTTVAVKKDERAFQYLLQHGCIITKAGIEISVLDRSWGTAKVRAYVGNQAVVLWTNTENINR